MEPQNLVDEALHVLEVNLSSTALFKLNLIRRSMTPACFISPGALAHLGARPSLPHGGRCRPSRPRLAPRMSQASDRSARVVAGPFAGHYGEWVLTQADVDGVLFYRGSLLASAIFCASGVLLAHTSYSSPLALDALFGLHSAAFGCALASIHIYLRPMHNMLKALFAAGGLGALALLAANGGPGVVEMVVERPALMLAVGWQFVALTGLFFKESVCFGRLEALALTGLVPVIAGGHFLGIVNGGVADNAMVAFAVGYLLFAARKFTQEAGDDLGDKSVFDYMAKQER